MTDTAQGKGEPDILSILKELKAQYEKDSEDLRRAKREIIDLESRNSKLEKLADSVYHAQHAKVWSPEASQGSHDLYIQSDLSSLGKRVR